MKNIESLDYTDFIYLIRIVSLEITRLEYSISKIKDEKILQSLEFELLKFKSIEEKLESMKSNKVVKND